MKAFTLHRAVCKGDAILGLLIERGGMLILATVESAHDAVPPGSYLVKRDLMGTHRWWTLIGDTVHPTSVPWADRTACELHPANVARELDGCVALGLLHIYFRAEDHPKGYTGFGVGSSTKAFQLLLEHVGDEDFWMTIEDATV